MNDSRLERWLLPNGLVVLYRHRPEVPLVAATLLLRTGSWQERPEQAGLASFALEVMLQGTTTRSPRQLAREIEFMGGSLGSQCSEDYSDIQLMAPSDQLPRALDLLSDVLCHPQFPQEELVKEREHTLASLRSRTDVLFNVAYDQLNKELFGDHAYGRLLDGTPQTIARFTRRDLKAWRERHIHPQGSVFSMVSPVSVAKARKLIETYLGRWKNPTPGLASSDPHALSPTLPSAITTLRVVKHAAFEQGYLMLGMSAPAVHQPGYRALKVLNTILGGGMSSRLFLELREKRGLAYEVASFFPTHLQPSQWVLYMGLPHDKLALAEKEMNRLLAQVAHRGVTPAELTQAKKMILTSYVTEHQTRRRQAWYAAWWEFLGREPSYETEYRSEVQAITRKDIHEVAARLLASPRITVVVTPLSRTRKTMG